MFEVEVAREADELPFEEGHRPRCHGGRVDAAPDGMGMAAAFLLMKDDGARLPVQSEAAFRVINRLFEFGLGDSRALRRAQ